MTRAGVAILLLLVLVGTARCGRVTGPSHSDGGTSILRVGLGLAPTQAPGLGARAFISNISFEGLLRVDPGGRARPVLAESWKVSTDGLMLTLQLRKNVTFHDGSPADAETIAQSLRQSLPRALGSVFEDVDTIAANGTDGIVIRFRRPSPFVAESLDVAIQKPGGSPIGTTPFMEVPREAGSTALAEMAAYPRYYLGPSPIKRILINAYPSIRAAWADMLRDRLDMLYEVRDDALDSMRGATTVSLFTFERPYQYVVVLNTRAPKLQSPEIRRALNQAIDRPALVRDGLAGQGSPSQGPVSPHHWAFESGGSTFTYTPQSAAALTAKQRTGQRGSDRHVLTLKCLVLTGAPYERLALIVKQQLEAVDVVLDIEEVSLDGAIQAMAKRDFEAVLIEYASGWNLFRPYRFWHSQAASNYSGFSDPAVDAGLDRVRHAANDDEYGSGVAAFQKAIAEDPPAIFLAWSNGSRAVTRRLDVQPEPGRDVLSSMRLWRPVADKLAARN
jgi:peptide/nickel transport system substrate-binding protein